MHADCRRLAGPTTADPPRGDQLGRTESPNRLGSEDRALPPPRSPVGPLLIAGDEAGLRLVHFGSEAPGDRTGWEPDHGRLDEAVRQLDAYLAGALRRFDLPLAPEGTEFQRRVWQALLALERGQKTLL